MTTPTPEEMARERGDIYALDGMVPAFEAGIMAERQRMAARLRVIGHESRDEYGDTGPAYALLCDAADELDPGGSGEAKLLKEIFGNDPSVDIAAAARALRKPMSDAEKDAQRRDWAYGNTKLSNEAVTREMIDKAADAMKAANACTKPPPGWTCSRGRHEDGPCAALPVPTHPLAQTAARRPRGNFTVCDGRVWVSWGPTEVLPDTRTGFDVMVRTGAPHPPGWVSVFSSDGDTTHPDYTPLTKQHMAEIIDGLCEALATFTSVWPREMARGGGV